MTPISAAGASPRNTVAVTMARKLLETLTRLAGVSTAVTSLTIDTASSSPKSGRFQLLSPSQLRQIATAIASARAAPSSAMTFLLGRAGMAAGGPPNRGLRPRRGSCP